MAKKRPVGELIKEQFRKVEEELRRPDLIFSRFRCPICHGYGGAKGALTGSTADPKAVGLCYYCNGTGVARRRKRRG